MKTVLFKPSNNSAFEAYEAEMEVCENDAESTEPVKAPLIGPVTVKDPVITTFPTWFNEPVAAVEPLIIGLSIIIS